MGQPLPLSSSGFPTSNPLPSLRTKGVATRGRPFHLLTGLEKQPSSWGGLSVRPEQGGEKGERLAPLSRREGDWIAGRGATSGSG